MSTRKPSMYPKPWLATLSAAFILTICADAPLRAAATEDARVAIAAQSRAFMDGMERGDSGAVAALFTLDAKLIVSGVDGVIAGRGAIESFWKSGINNGVKGLRMTTLDLDGTGSLLVETGTYQVLGTQGADLGRGHYMFVWKEEGGTWKIHRDIASAKTAQPVTRATASVDSVAAAAATTDRVGFPHDYRAALKLLGVGVKDEEPSVMAAYGNELAASVKNEGQLPYPYGTVIAMEFAHGVRDGEGQLMYDASGTAQRADVARIDVMRRERGYGAAYGESRAGEWEFASYRPDGSMLLAAENAASCAACHRKAGPERDFVYRLRVPAR